MARKSEQGRFETAQRLDALIARGWARGFGARVELVFPPFWGGKTAYRISTFGEFWTEHGIVYCPNEPIAGLMRAADPDGTHVPPQEALCSSARGAYYTLRRMLRSARHSVGLAGDQSQ